MDRPGQPLEAAWEGLEQARGINWSRWLALFVGLGVLTRLARYALRFPLWDDETFLCVSLHNRGFGELLEPLARHQVAPFLFLWIEKAVTLVFGFNELSLRLVPCLVSVGSVFLVAHLARRLFSRPIQAVCLAWYAVSYPGIRYAAEAKQYATDLWASLVLIVLVVEWLRDPDRRRWIVALVVWTPIAICLSLPAVFTAAGLSLLLAGAMVHDPGRRRPAAWLLYNLALLGSLVLVYVVSLRPQMHAELGFMSDCWNDGFVPLNSATRLATWLVTAHTGILFAHPMGDNHFGSSLTTLLCVVGVVYALRRRRALVAALFLLPLLMHLGAAALRRYPYGGHFKFSMYIAPMIYLTMGLGCAVLLGIRVRRKTPAQFARTVTVVLLLIGTIGIGSLIRDLLNPYKTPADARQRALARWLWHDGNFEGRTVDLYDDLGLSFSPRTWDDLGWSAMYLCNKYIYTPDDMVREPRPAYAPAPETAELRCVLYKDLGKGDFDQAAFDRWLAGARKELTYLGSESYPLVRHDKHNRRIVTVDYLEIYRFVLPADRPWDAVRTALHAAGDVGQSG